MKEAIRITLIYIIVAALWIFFSDSALAMLNLDIQTVVRISQYKGFFYVLVTGILLFSLIKKEMTEKNEVIVEQKTTLQQKEEVMRELHHRIKNNLQNIISIIHLETGEHGLTEVTTERILNKLYALSAIHDLVYTFAGFSHISLRQVLLNFFSYRLIPVQPEQLHISDAVQYSLEEMVPLALSFNELFEELTHFPHSYRFTITAKQKDTIDTLIYSPEYAMLNIDQKALSLYLTGSGASSTVIKQDGAVLIRFSFPAG